MKRILDGRDDWTRVADFVASQIGIAPFLVNYTAVGLESNGEIVAGVVYNGYNGANIHASIAGVGKHWLTPDFLWFMFYYPFCQVGAKRITACVEQMNNVSQQFVEKLGFKFEFPMERAGKTGDLLVYRMFKEDCRYLERRRWGIQQSNLSGLR